MFKNQKLIYILIIYLIFNILSTNYVFFKNLINPIFWLIIIIYIILFNKNNYIRYEEKKNHYYIILIIIFIYLISDFLLGNLINFTNSPYSHDFLAIIINIFTILIPIIGLELSRSLLIKRNKTKIVFITILFILLEINIIVFLISYPIKNIFLNIFVLLLSP